MTRHLRSSLGVRALWALCALAPAGSCSRGGVVTGVPDRPASRAPVSETVSAYVQGGVLYGTLLLPASPGPFPTALIIAGSGPTDRDGNQVLSPGRNDALRLLADGLAARGIASLRYDKRGVGASAATVREEADVRVEDFAADAGVWVRQLAADPRISRVVIVGHSEGALVGTLVAQGQRVAGVLTLEGAGRSLDQVLVSQLAAQLPPVQVDVVRQVLAELKAGRTVAPLPPELPEDLASALFRPSVQPYLISIFRYDPAPELGRVAAQHTPVAVVQGTTDLQVSVEDAERLAAAAGVTPVLVTGMNHVLRQAPADRSANLATYFVPTTPLAPGVLDSVSAFVAQTR